MNVLGMSFDFHDSGVALVSDGKLLGVESEERHTLQKHDSSYPAQSINALLNNAGIDLEDIDEIVFYENPYVKYSRVLTTGFWNYPRGASQFVSASKVWLKEKLWTKPSLCNRFSKEPDKVVIMPHHDSHIAQAFLTSPFQDAAILIADGVGEWECTTLAVADNRSPSGIRIVEKYEYPCSIGLVYAVFTSYLGFQPNSGEANTMALAAYGRASYVDDVRRILRLTSGGGYELGDFNIQFDGLSQAKMLNRMEALFGECKKFKEPYDFDSLANPGVKGESVDQRFADIACSLQYVVEEILVKLVEKLRASTSSKNLCFGGGVAYNCVANTKIANRCGFENVYVPPEPGDGGACFGAAMHRASVYGPVSPIRNPYLGSKYSLDQIRSLLRESKNCNFLLGKQLHGVLPATEIIMEEFKCEDSLLECVVGELYKGRIVGWHQGRYEIGPRALGNRSLLVAPNNLEAIKRISRNIKSHADFRPYALSMTAELASSVIQASSPTSYLNKWMQGVCSVTDGAIDKVRGVYMSMVQRVLKYVPWKIMLDIGSC